MTKINFDRKLRRKRRISSNIKGTKMRPRISVFRSNRYVYAQVIDDVERKTLFLISNFDLKKEVDYKKGKKEEDSRKIGIKLAKKLIESKIKIGVFDRGSYAYNGRVKALAEGLREGGLKI
ncbi:MAG: 50S ribosomal protein L18 [Candidatus Roizmanbacteria bacterium GW2011_GWA2_32_13]|uniref:Large ribosomal subunit protein uL18 n=1 Tax=Candidatus Roizmanbacteria bacterium GW2011_GWA2_32_13 TaxID=1618475 RepID=A0A0F9ZC33_9BACT|nr:MAG: 50S ribosomal protein L18 [Candidatus Roizmanbacteria bacterium GW2011_GWA2_32_13]